MTSTSAKSCTICCEDFNKSSRACINCPACSLQACRKCIRTYLLGSSELPHCMQCKNRWERDFLIKATLQTFVRKEYQSHRANLLLEQEKSRLPETMPLVENYLKVASEKKKKEEMRKKIITLRGELDKYRRTFYICAANIRRYSNGEAASNEKREFKRACPVTDCLGFLSTQWKCGVCNIWVCPTCMEIKGEYKDTPHECNPDTVATAQLLKKDTKNCPSCAAMIYKISGCDQMWCTQCHIAFSWRTGRRVNGVIHNPHFYHWQTNGGGGGNVNAPGAAVCGGLPDIYALRGLLTRFSLYNSGSGPYHYHPNGIIHITSCIEAIDKTCSPDAAAAGDVKDSPHWCLRRRIANFILKLHRAMNHFGQVVLRNMRFRCQNVTNNTNLRIKYAVKEITEAKLKSDVARRDKSRQKSTAILHIYELLNTVFVESFRDILEAGQAIQKGKGSAEAATKTWLLCIQRNFKRCNEVRLYGNRELVKISVMYHQQVEGLRGDFFSGDSRKYKTIDLENNTGTLFV